MFIFFKISLYTHTRLGIVVKTGQNMWFGFSRSQRIHSYRQFPPGSSTVYYRWGLIKSNHSNQADFNALSSTIRTVGCINVNFKLTNITLDKLYFFIRIKSLCILIILNFNKCNMRVEEL